MAFKNQPLTILGENFPVKSNLKYNGNLQAVLQELYHYYYY